jgi:hypothetical protein
LIFHIRTCPSRPPVATRWYERPHEGAHDTEVIAEAAVVLLAILGFEGVRVGMFVVSDPVGSVDVDVVDVSRDALIPAGGGTTGGDELRVRRVAERRAFNCMI